MSPTQRQTTGQTRPSLVRPSRSVRISMADLHANGGVPPGWTMTLLPTTVTNGRKLFADFGCESCHAVRGEPFDDESFNIFDSDPRTEQLGNDFDAFIGPHDHLVFKSPVLYKVQSLSAP